MIINLDAALLIFLRVTGFIFLNDITGRKSIPILAKVVISVAISLCFINVYSKNTPQINGILDFGMLAIKEILIGFILGFIINLFLSAIVMGGELIDFHIGLSISKIYDAQTNISMPVSASIINAMFFLLFFGMNGHLTLISLIKTSFDLIDIGSVTVNPNVFYNICEMFSQILLLGLKIAQPIIAIMFITEIGIAIIMRAIPQLNIFTINIQMKILLGIILLFIVMPLFTRLIEQIIVMLFDNIYLAINAIATG